MIVSNLQHSNKYEALNPKFKQVFDYIKEHDLLNTDPGRIEIDADNIYINNSLIDGVEKEKQQLEMHRRYIDIHVLLQGSETIGWKSIEYMKAISKPYDNDADCAFSSDTPASYTTLTPGEFLIAYPEDLHAPAIGTGKIRKLIAKIRI